MQIALDNFACFQQNLLYINQSLYFRDEKRRWRRLWHKDSAEYKGLNVWFKKYYGLELSKEETKRFVAICVEASIIPEVKWEGIHPGVIEDFMVDSNLTPMIKAVLLNCSADKRVVTTLVGNSLPENSNARIAMQIICDNATLFQEDFRFVKGSLKFRCKKVNGANFWCQDSPQYNGLKKWFFYEYGLKLTATEIKLIIRLCVQNGLIIQMTEDEFLALEVADILTSD